MDGFEYSPAPPQAVTDYLALKQLRPSFSWQDVMLDEHSFSFTVAKATQLNVLRTFQESLIRAEAEGIPFAQWSRDIEPELRRLGWWGVQDVDELDAGGNPTGRQVPARLGSPRRLRTIYWANTRTARAAGQWERIQSTKAALGYLLYQLGPSENHRPHHEVHNGLILRVDDAFWEVWLPPNGWGCKCHVRQISLAEAQRRGFVDAPAPIIPEQSFTNSRTGEVMAVPLGIDPGWNINPGLTRARNIRRFLADDFNAAPLNLARIAIADYTRDSEFRAMMLGQRPDQFAIPIARIPDDVAATFGTSTQTIIVSSQTLAAHNAIVNPAKYPPPEEWSVIMERIAAGEAEIYIQDGGKVLHIFFNHSGAIETRAEQYRAKLTRTVQGDEIFLSTFHPWDKRKPKHGRRIK